MGRHRLEVCVAGLHDLKGKNAIIKPDGSRQCRACRTAARAKLRAKKRAILERVKQEARFGN